MKRALSLLLCLSLTLCLALPVLAADEEEPLPEVVVDAAAPEGDEPAPEIDLGMLEPGEGGVSFPVPEQEQTMDAALAALTLQVKQTLGVDDSYTDFSSDYYDGPSPLWSLYWTGEDRQLTVQARPDGTVVNMYRWENEDSSERFYGFDPVFPSLTRDEAAAQAQAWCEKLFTGAETGRLDETRAYLGGSGYYRFDGTVLKNGLESPVGFNMVIDGTGMTSFYRQDQTDYAGPLPEARPDADEAAAQAGLAGAVELELRWVSDGEGGAKLMYVPVGARTVVDAATGETVDMDALYEALEEKGLNGAYDTMAMTEEASAAMDGGSGGAYLTEIEQSSIGNYGDVLDGAAIDEALRALNGLGLDGFTQERCSYAMDSETGGVTASVRYAGTMTEDRLYGYSRDAFAAAVNAGQDLTIYKYITVDAKTGALKSLSTSYPIWDRQEEDEPSLDAQAELAAPFVEQALPELADQVAGCTLKGYEERDSVVFARMYEGYFYPDDRIEVHADPASGVIDQFWYAWDEDTAFGPAEGIIDADEALEAYTDAMELTLGYVAWPVDITAEPDGPYAEWMRWGYTYIEELRLAYYYSGTENVQGVDALTGQVERAAERDDAFTYDDLAGVPGAEQIESLGLAGVGFAGGSFLPEQELTMRDAALLLLRAAGSYAPEGDDSQLGEQAFYHGFIADRAWDPDETVSRMAFLRMLIGPSRYGYAAGLTGVWNAGFADVDPSDEAVAAIARALGLADGDTLSPDETLTRAGAAALLARFMTR